MKLRKKRLPIILLTVCLANLGANLAYLPTRAHSPGDIAGNPLPRASAPARTQTPPPITDTVAAHQPQTSLPAQGQPVRFERISTADGLSFPIVRQILQDRQGFMWFATDGGLNRYDGYGFTVYKNDPGDPTSLRFGDVRAIYEDRYGTLWVGGAGGLDRYNRTTGTFTHVDTRGQVYSIYEDSAGTLWVGFWHGLYGYDPATGTIEYSYQRDPNAPDDLRMPSDNAVLTIYEDQRGNLWIGTVGGLDLLDRTTGTFAHFRHDPDDPGSLSHNSVNDIFEDRQGVLWIGTGGGGLSRLDRSTGTFTRYQHNPEDVEHSLGDDRMSSILEDSTGTLWVGTAGGLDQFDRSQDRFAHFQHDPADPRSLSDDVVISLYEDRSGVLWIGTANGVSKYNRRVDQFTHHQKRLDLPTDEPTLPGLSDSKVLAIYEDRDGMLWIGTFTGGLNKLDRKSGNLTVYQHDPADPASLSSNQVHAVFEDSAGVLWVGTSNGWLEKFDPQTETFIHQRHLGEIVTSITEDLSGNLWIGTGGDGLYRLDRERVTLVHYEHFWRDPDHWKLYGSLSSHIITSLYVDQSGVLWVGTGYGGINLWDEVKNRFTHYRHDPDDPNSLSRRQVLSIFEDSTRYEGVVWIGTGGGGLNRFDRSTQTFTRYTEEDGLLGDTVGCILTDDAGFLWLGTVKGLSRFDPRTETFRNYDERDGVGVLSIGLVAPGVCFQSQTGEMLFGGFDGFYAFYPEQIKENLHIPPIAITALKIFNQTVRTDLSADEHIILSYQDNFVSFEFAALDYTIPDKNQYAYIMEGLDEDWVYAGTRRHADYPNLRPGNYVFRVKGSNNDGVWNEEGIAIRITVEPPIWETWVFRVMVAVALVLGTIGVYRQRVRNIKARSRELESQVEERTHQLEALYHAEERLHRHLHLDQVLQALVDVAVEVMQADKSAVMVWAGDIYVERRERLVMRVARGFSPEAMAQLSLAWGQDATEVAVSGGPMIVEDAATAADPCCEGERAQALQAIAAEGVRSFMHLPIQVGGEPFGVFNVSFTEPHAFGQDEQRLFLAVAQRASLAIENAQLYERAQELAAVEERQRLARDLHDAVTQTLFSTSLIAEVLPQIWEQDPDDGRRRLEQVRQAARSALAEMRALLLELRPAVLAETDLGDLLCQLGEAITGRARVSVAVEVEGACILPPDVHVALYRIVQEALNNAAKHARASQAIVTLHCQPGQVTLFISDDGRGFDVNNVPPGHFGLNIMRERAETVGAHLEIESQAGHGTRVTVLWTKER